jgi:hypothetical protein
MPENDPPKLRVGFVLCCPCRATPALLGTQGQVFLKARRSKHRRRMGAEHSRESLGGGDSAGAGLSQLGNGIAWGAL